MIAPGQQASATFASRRMRGASRRAANHVTANAAMATAAATAVHRGHNRASENRAAAVPALVHTNRYMAPRVRVLLDFLIKRFEKTTLELLGDLAYPRTKRPRPSEL
jgi:hypothetical protein